MEPFPRFIEIQEDWQYFINAYGILTNKIDRLAEDYSDMLIEYGFKDQHTYRGEPCRYEFSYSYVELSWEYRDRCGDTEYCSFVLPVDFLLASDPHDIMRERVEAKAKERDRVIAEKEKTKQEEATRAKMASQQVEIEKIRKRMAEDPEFAQEILKKMGE